MESQIVNILMVDDREENLLALEAVLTSPNYNLIKAQSGEEALKWVLKTEFAVIIMDVQMPGMNGFETAKMIRRREKTMDIPIIFVTALSQTFENVLHGYSVGAIDYIIKPFDAFILNSKVNGFVSLYLNQKKIEKQARTISERTKELEAAYSALKKSEDRLERLVKKRTEELVLTNTRLKEEVISKQKMLLQLEESEKQYRQLVEESPEAIILKKIDSMDSVFVNHTCVELLKAKSKEEIVGRPLIDFVYPEDQAKVKNIKLFQDHEKLSFECRLVCLNGDVIDVEVNAIQIGLFGDSFVHIMVRDITELKQSREVIQQTEKLTVVGELAAGIAHEIRNPLTSLKGFTQLVSSKVGFKQEYIEIMIAEIERINTIVSELLLLTKPKKMEFNEIKLLTVLEKMITLMNAQANLCGVSIELNNYTSLKEPSLSGVENKLKQVFINIIKNAIEAMKEGGKIVIKVRQKGDEIELQFIDDGAGIPPELLTKLGQPFLTTKENGTGLGLMVCYSIIKSHQGSMVIDSIMGKGTNVTIRLPIYQASTQSLAYLVE